MNNFIKLSLVFTSIASSVFALDINKDIEVEGQLRIGYVNDINHNTTNAIGGHIGLKTKPFEQFTVATTIYTTNQIGTNSSSSEFTFLSSQNKSYTILGEAYIEANRSNTTLKAGRLLIDTPFINSDDVQWAMDRPLPVDNRAPLIIGVDVARFGDNDTVIYPRIGAAAGLDKNPILCS